MDRVHGAGEGMCLRPRTEGCKVGRVSGRMLGPVGTRCRYSTLRQFKSARLGRRFYKALRFDSMELSTCVT